MADVSGRFSFDTCSRNQAPPWSAPTCRRFGTKAVPRHRTPRRRPTRSCTMKLITLVFGVLFSLTLARAQTTKPAVAKSAAATDAALELKERRAKARSLLVALSTDARTFH